MLSAALQHHQAGRLAAAEPIYRQILAIDPANADALNLFGVLAHQVGRHDVAVELIGQATRINSREPSFLHNLGAALLALGRHEDMASAFRRAIDLQPGNPEGHFNLGVALQGLGRLDEAVAAYRRVIQLQADHALAHANLGAVLKAQNKPEDAAQALSRATELQPNYAPAHNNLGVVLEDLGRLYDALASYERAIALKPDFAAAHGNLGGALLACERPAEAEASYRRAIALQPDYAQAHNNLGAVLKALDRPDEALECYRRAIALKPDYGEAHGNLAAALQQAGLHEQASGSYRRAAELTPDDPMIHYRMGVTLQDAGRPDDAAGAFSRAVQLKPDFVEAASHRLLALNYTDISAQALLADHRAWTERYGGGPGPVGADYANSRDPERKLRVGFVSADFNFHPVGIYLTRVLMARDPQALEVFCYYNNTEDDEFTGLLRRTADEWRSLVGVSDEDAEAIIRQDEIDILVDLSGHTGGHRLTLFARRPAPVQASWLGYPSTTGLAAIDYLLMDAAAVPEGAERFCSEAVVRLPFGRFCYTAPAYAPEVVDPASRDGEPITLGSFNNLAKVGPPVIRLWAEVLKAVPGSRLVLKWKALEDPAVRRRIGQAFGRLGIPAERLEFRAATPHVQMLAEYGQIDIALDTFPFNGGLTSCEALWMGVPVVTLPGERPVSRQTLGFLDVLGIEGLAAGSEAEYVHIAKVLAADSKRRADLRVTLRPRMADSPLCDPARFTPTLEAAFRQMWRRWCAGEPATTFDITPGG
jgi:predicted O-linked N-acetylglucosamine transferase (SPINDLY family)